MLTGVHDDVGHLWRHLGDHNGPNALGELLHCNLGMKKGYLTGEFTAARRARHRKLS